jgi:hypothetical protein
MKFSVHFGFALVVFTVGAQQLSEPILKPLFPDDPKGLQLPPAVPRMVDTNGNVAWIDEGYTTRAYQRAAFKMVLQEANQVARELKLPEKLPITETNLAGAFVGPFGFNYLHQSVGNVTTEKYCYYVSKGNKFCYLEGTHQTEDAKKYQDSYTWPINRMNTNQAYRLAIKYLAAVSMDVKAMNRDCLVAISLDNAYVNPPPGEFVPIYWVSWTRKGSSDGMDWTPSNDVASVEVFTPTKILMTLRVEDPQYILRKPLVFTNLHSLLPGKAPVVPLPPPQPGGHPLPD